MGGALNGAGLSGNHGSSLCLAKPNDQHQVSHRGLHWISEDERTVRTACLKPVCRIGPYTAEGFQRTGARRISSWPGDFNLHKQAGYIDADFPSPSTFPLQSDGGPYISATTVGTRPKGTLAWSSEVPLDPGKFENRPLGPTIYFQSDFATHVLSPHHHHV
jgi:hypothetical protein